MFNSNKGKLIQFKLRSDVRVYVNVVAQKYDPTHSVTIVTEVESAHSYRPL